MSDLSVMPVSCWEEWTAILQCLFCVSGHTTGEEVINKANYMRGLTYLQCVLHRDRYKNNLSMSYTSEFMSDYQAMQRNNLDDSTLVHRVGLNIVRFSSQMADMSQKGTIKSINNALAGLGMVEHEFISEVRHALTHKQLPSALLIKRALIYLIEFLHEKYWMQQYLQLLKSDLIDPHLVTKYLHLILADHSNDTNIDLSSISTAPIIPSLINVSLKRMGNIIADNPITFRRRLNQIGILFVRNYDSQSDFSQLDNLKRKKVHLAYFLSELLRIVLRVTFYARLASTKEERENIIQNITRIMTDMTADNDFKKTLTKISSISFLEYKVHRIHLLAPIYKELQQLVIPLDLTFSNANKSAQMNIEEKKQDEEERPQVSQRKQSTSSQIIPSNKFGLFTLVNDHIPSLLGKKMNETL